MVLVKQQRVGSSVWYHTGYSLSVPRVLSLPPPDTLSAASPPTSRRLSNSDTQGILTTGLFPSLSLTRYCSRSSSRGLRRRLNLN